MSNITAGMVKELRERTGSGMMECKKALTETQGDLEAAVELMRKAGLAKADKKSGRTAAEGCVCCKSSPDGTKASIVEINSETDFAARADGFVTFSNNVAQTALKTAVTDVDALSSATLMGSSSTVEQARQELVSVIGENIKLRRLTQVHSDDVVGFYLHGARIGVVVALKNGDETLAKDIAMHIAAARPIVVSRDQVPADAIANEREVFTAQARESGKPQDIIDKMIEGRINKFVDEVCLSGQPFVKNPDIKVGQYLKDKQAEVISFTRFEVGEGIEKKEDNFVEEVMAQVREQ